MREYYTATGIIIGRDWGFGITGYTAKPQRFTDLDKWIKEMESRKDFDNLDGGMGYESTYGVKYEVTHHKELEDGFHATKYLGKFIFTTIECPKQARDFLKDTDR